MLFKVGLLKLGNSGSRVSISKTPEKRRLRKEKKYVDKDPELLKFTRQCSHNTTSYKCNTVTLRDIKLIRKKFYATPDKVMQDIKLCHMLGVCAKARKRSIKDNPKNRLLNITYFLQSSQQKSIRVCQAFFTASLGISKNRVNTVAKTIHEGGVPKENRGGDHVSNKTEDKKNKIREFIGNLRGTESHYNRKKSRRIYLEANLSIAKLHKIYNSHQPSQYKSSLSMFSRVFCGEYNIGFSSPAADCCALCIRLKDNIKKEKDPKKKSDLMIERRIHKKRADAFYKLAKENPPNSISFCFDLQQVQPLPRTPISDAFYSHQISFYVFCCVGMNSKSPTFYTWTEVQAGRGSVQIGSALLNYLDSLDLHGIEVLRLFCDGCGGQNKNAHIVHALYFWLQNRSPRTLNEIQLTFPVRGHSFLPADRVFGRVEKCLRTNPTILSKEEYVEVYSQFGTVKQLGVDWKLYNIKNMEKCLKKITGISDHKRILIKKSWNNKRQNIVKVQCHQNFRMAFLNETPQQILKARKEVPEVLEEIPLTRPLPEKKKKSLAHLMAQQFGPNWKDDESLEWYKNSILPETIEGTAEIENDHQDQDQDELCDCLEDDVGMHV